MTEHLDDAAVEAVAHGRNDLVADDLRVHMARCEACQVRVLEVREVSRELSFSLAAEAPEFANLDAMIASALQKAPAPAYARPSAVTLAGAGVLGLAATAVLALLSRPSLSAAVDFLRDAFALAGGVDRVVGAFVPGGWGLVAVLGFAALAAVALPLRRLVLARGPDASVVLSVFLTWGLVCAASFGLPRGAHALTFEGSWASPDDGHLVTLAVTDEELNVVLREAAASAGLAYVSQLQTDGRRVTLDVQGAELRLVLETVLADAPVIARRTEAALVLMPDPGGTAAPETLETPVADLEAPAIPDAPAVPVAPSAPAAPEPVGSPPSLAAPTARTKTRPNSLRDRETFGGDVRIRSGEEVRNVVSTGGDVVVEGVVWGAVTSMGGGIEVKDGGVVHGEMVTMGGDIDVRAGGTAHGQMITMGGEVEVEDGATVSGAMTERPRRRWGPWGGRGDDDRAVDEHDGQSLDGEDRHEGGGFSGWVEGALRGAASHALLFVFGVLLLTLAPARFDALRRTLVRAPVRSSAAGLMGVFGAVVMTVVLTVTMIGIPAAAVLVVLSIVGGYVGLLASASVLGAALPHPKLKGKPVVQVGAGVAVLYLASLVPGLGALLTIAAVLAGFGALIMTRFQPVAVGD